MSGLSINGVPTGGVVYELKADIDKKAALQAAKKDGLDDVFFEADGKNFMVQGQELNLSGLKSDKNQVSVEVNGKSFLVSEYSTDLNTLMRGQVPTNPSAQIQFADFEAEAKITAVDNEVSSAKEGVKEAIGAAIGFGAGVGAAITAVGSVCSFFESIGSVFTYYPKDPTAIPSLKVGAIAAVGIAGVMLTNAAIQGSKEHHPEVMDPFKK
jgi:hypothetical protein